MAKIKINVCATYLPLITFSAVQRSKHEGSMADVPRQFTTIGRRVISSFIDEVNRHELLRIVGILGRHFIWSSGFWSACDPFLFVRHNHHSDLPATGWFIGVICKWFN